MINLRPEIETLNFCFVKGCKMKISNTNFSNENCIKINNTSSISYFGTTIHRKYIMLYIVQGTPSLLRKIHSKIDIYVFNN